MSEHLGIIEFAVLGGLLGQKKPATVTDILPTVKLISSGETDGMAQTMTSLTRLAAKGYLEERGSRSRKNCGGKPQRLYVATPRGTELAVEYAKSLRLLLEKTKLT